MSVPDLQHGRILWSLQRLASEFGIDWRTIKSRLNHANVQPADERKGKPVYLLIDAAPAILKDQVIFAGGADVDDLPPDMRDKHYAAELKKLQVQTQQGDLIPVEQYRDDLAETLKALVQFIDTLPDVLDRDCGLSPEQIDTVQATCDAQRETLYRQLNE